MHWLITDRGDQDVRRLIDGETTGTAPHYSRQSPGHPQYTRNGDSTVFVTADLRAAWISFRPTPGKATRSDGLEAWECALFRNEGALLSSTLIIEAVALTDALWGVRPSDGMITFIKPEAVRSSHLKRRGEPFARPPGYCYRMAGWFAPPCKRPKCADKPEHEAHSGDGKPLLRAPDATEIADWHLWRFKNDRGGRLRQRLEQLPGFA